MGCSSCPRCSRFVARSFRSTSGHTKPVTRVFPVRGRRVDHAVHLETRCDGSAHGGCQASCLLFWKDAWLKPVSESSPAAIGIDTALPVALLPSGVWGVRCVGFTTQQTLCSRTYVRLPGHPTSLCHHRSRMVGCSPVHRRLSFGEREPLEDSLWCRVFPLLRNQQSGHWTGPSDAVVLRHVLSAVARRSISAKTRNNTRLRGYAYQDARPETGRTGSHQALQRNSEHSQHARPQSGPLL